MACGRSVKERLNQLIQKYLPISKEQTFNILFFFRNVFGRKLWEARFFFGTKEWKAATDDPPNTHATGDFRKLKGFFLKYSLEKYLLLPHLKLYCFSQFWEKGHDKY